MNADVNKRSRTIYLIQAAFEYFISILVTGAFLATLTASLGFSDSLTGILSSVISLGSVFGLLSISYRGKRVKRFLIILTLLDELLFLLLYIIPVFEFSATARTVIFSSAIILAYAFLNISYSKKMSWLMSFVSDDKYGEFTASKEIISLIGGMIFTYLCGELSDRFKSKGNLRGAFICLAIVLLCCSVVNTLCLLLTPEKKPAVITENKKKTPLSKKSMLTLAVLYSLYYSSIYIATPFYGSYQVKELGFSLKFVGILSVFYGAVRAIFSRLFGKIGDRKSFRSLFAIVLSIQAFAFFINIFTVPENGKIFYMAYYCLHAVAYAGTNNCISNLAFDYSPPERRADCLAVYQAIGGAVGFAVSLLGSAIVSNIQKNGNTVFGIPMYSQQLLSAIASAVSLLAVLYTCTVIRKMKRLRNV